MQWKDVLNENKMGRETGISTEREKGNRTKWEIVRREKCRFEIPLDIDINKCNVYF